MSNGRIIPIVMENGAAPYVPPAHRKPEHSAIFEPSGSYIHRLRPEQIEMLEQEFTKAKTLHNTDLELLAAEMGLNEADVQAWYGDRISLWRKEQGLADGFSQS